MYSKKITIRLLESLMQTYLHPRSELVFSAELEGLNGIMERVVRLLGPVQGSLDHFKNCWLGQCHSDSMKFEMLRRELWAGSA